ncbi:hypothetical protein DY000_02048365 [Brassica cretica]|uniref:Uncharacterized protein n=1 Tax=Brassica cretica TaxID=69181 RepID=A0ABQ7FC53_BRACR|nr:hypothetical protein DY000_02048365 [Brassica cretica]
MEVQSTKRDQGKSSYFSNQQTPLTSSAHYMYSNKVHPASISPVTFSTEALDDKGEEILGSFENAEVRCSDGERAKGDKVKRYYELTFEKKLREKVMGPYLRHVVAISEESKKSLRVVIIAKVWRRATDALVALV